MKRWTLAAACTAAVLSLAACGANPHAGTASPSTSGHPTPMHSDGQQTSLNTTLQAYHWYLDKAEDASGRPQAQFKALEPKLPVRLDFLAGSQPGAQMVSTKVCNTMQGSYTLEGDKIQVRQLMSTQMACMNEQLSQLERAVGEQLGRMQSVQMVQGAPTPRMVLQFSDGSRWHMAGQPTDTTRYGGAGETLFLEVAPQTQPCVSGVMRTQCLQVREVRYDAAGRKTVAKEWQNFHGSIQGFTHEPGVRNVLRIKRYPVKNPPADGSAFAYVLDSRVETELLRP